MVSPWFVLGWASAITATAVCHHLGTMVLIAVFALGAYRLWRSPGFPKQREALRSSWIGPLVAGAWCVTYRLFLASRHGAPDLPASLTALTTAAAVGGCFTALFMVWLWRGYGFLLLLSLGTPFPRSTAPLRQAAAAYPWRFWWAVPAFFLIKPLVLVALAYAFIGR